MSSSDEHDDWEPNLPDGDPPERILRRMAGKLVFPLFLFRGEKHLLLTSIKAIT